MLALALAIGCGDPEVADSSAPADRDGDGDGFEIGEDCADDDAAIHPGAEERCDGLDDDCDGAVDEEPVDEIALFVDADADGYGGAEAGAACSAGVLQATVGGDCDDEDPGAHPGAVEICNGGIDDDCDGLSDDDDVPAGTVAWYADADLDGYGGGVATLSCDGHVGWTEDGSDCNDADGSIHPGATELCDGIDNDCDAFSLETGSVFVDDVRFGSIQDAIDAAPDGGSVNVCDGTWFENLHVEHRKLTIQGAGAELSIIDGSRAGSVLVADGGSVLALRALTFQHGDTAASGGGVDATKANALTMEDCIVAENHADEDAGGISAPAYGPTHLTGVIVRDNDAVYSGGGAVLYNRREWTTDIADSQFLGNHGGAFGGGIAFFTSRHNGRVSVSNTVVDGNWIDFDPAWPYGRGGGIYSACGLVLQAVTVSNNRAPYAGGGIAHSGERACDADDATEIFGNATDDGGFGGGVASTTHNGWHYGHIHDNTASYGGGVYILAYSGSLTDAVIENNHATLAGGGVWATRIVGLTNVQILGNTSDDIGGGLYLEPYYDEVYVLKASSIEGNVAATAGGGAYLAAARAESDGSDWGTGATDNAPDDILFQYSTDGDSIVYSDFETSESFVCDTETRTCE